jgi:putative membrane protein
VKPFAIFAAALLLAGCATKSPPPEVAPSARASRPPVVRSISVSPAQYVSTASSASLYVIRASQFMAGRQGDSGLGNVARQFASEQEGVGSQLSFAGRRLNVLPQARLDPAHQAMLDALTASGDPAATYVSQMSELLPRLAAFHRQYQRYGTSPTLRPVAAMAAPVFERETVQLRGWRSRR